MSNDVSEKIKCPMCKRLLDEGDVLIDIQYRNGGCEKVHICPHCLGDL